MAFIWLLCGPHMALIWPLCGPYVPLMWPICAHHGPSVSARLLLFTVLGPFRAPACCYLQSCGPYVARMGLLGLPARRYLQHLGLSGPPLAAIYSTWACQGSRLLLFTARGPCSAPVCDYVQHLGPYVALICPFCGLDVAIMWPSWALCGCPLAAIYSTWAFQGPHSLLFTVVGPFRAPVCSYLQHLGL